MSTHPGTTVPRKIIRNTLFNSAGRVWMMAVALLLTPYIVSRLGIEGFGVWSLMLVITSYLQLFNFGIREALVKYVAEFDAKDDALAISRLINTGLAVYLLLGSLILVIAWDLRDTVITLLRVPATLHADARFVLLVVAVAAILSMVADLFEAVLIGLQRMDVISMITVVTSIPNLIATVILLELGYGLQSLAVIRAMLVTLNLLLLGSWVFRLLPDLQINPRLVRGEILRRILSYGAWLQVTALGGLVNLETPKILVNHFLGVGAVGLYELGFKVAYTILSLPMLLVSAITPAASELEAREHNHLLHELYLRGTKYVGLVAIPMTVFIFLEAPLITSTWLGASYNTTILVVRFLAAAFFANLIIGVGTTIMRGIGRPDYETRYALLTIAVHLILGIILIRQAGLIGMLLATSVALITGSVYFLRIFHAYFERSVSDFFRALALPLGSSLIAGGLGYSPNLVLNLTLDSRWLGLGVLGLKAGLFFGVYVWMVLQSNYLDAYDRKTLLNWRQMGHLLHHVEVTTETG